MYCLGIFSPFYKLKIQSVIVTAYSNVCSNGTCDHRGKMPALEFPSLDCVRVVDKKIRNWFHTNRYNDSSVHQCCWVIAVDFLNLGSLRRQVLIILTIFMCVVLVSYGCCNKLPQAQCLRAMNIYFLSASEIWSNSSEAEMEVVKLMEVFSASISGSVGSHPFPRPAKPAEYDFRSVSLLSWTFTLMGPRS